MSDIVKQTEYGLNRGNLKMIALFCMTLDHFAVMIFDSWLMLLSKDSLEYTCVNTLEIAFRAIGRLAFPIFCYFIVEGLFYTRNIYKYCLRLLILAFISEIPFNMVLNHSFFTTRGQNVFWTLLIGLVVIYTVDGVLKKFEWPKAIKYAVCLTACLLGFYVGEYFQTDYGCIGVLTIVLIYLIGENEIIFAVILNIIGQCMKYYFDKKFTLNYTIIFALSLILISTALFICNRIEDKNSRKMFVGVAALCGFNMAEVPALVNIPLMRYYNGRKGKNSGWFFYAYYPLHLLALAGLAMLVKLY